MTGVQTCALPICFPVTIQVDEKKKEVKVEKFPSIALYRNGALYGLKSNSEGSGDNGCLMPIDFTNLYYMKDPDKKPKNVIKSAGKDYAPKWIHYGGMSKFEITEHLLSHPNHMKSKIYTRDELVDLPVEDLYKMHDDDHDGLVVKSNVVRSSSSYAMNYRTKKSRRSVSGGCPGGVCPR